MNFSLSSAGGGSALLGECLVRSNWNVEERTTEKIRAGFLLMMLLHRSALRRSRAEPTKRTISLEPISAAFLRGVEQQDTCEVAGAQSWTLPLGIVLDDDDNYHDFSHHRYHPVSMCSHLADTNTLMRANTDGPSSRTAVPRLCVLWFAVATISGFPFCALQTILNRYLWIRM